MRSVLKSIINLNIHIFLLDTAIMEKNYFKQRKSGIIKMQYKVFRQRKKPTCFM